MSLSCWALDRLPHTCKTVTRLGKAGTTAGLDLVQGRFQGRQRIEEGSEPWEPARTLVSTVFGDRQKAKFNRLVEVLKWDVNSGKGKRK